VKLSFLLPHLGGTQTAFKLIYNINTFSAKCLDTDIVIFYENLMRPCLKPEFATMNITDAYNYSGNIIATNLNTAYKISRFPRVKKALFYVVDLEWIKVPHKEYETLANIYQNPNIELLARSYNHARQIELCWNRPVKSIIHDFDILQFKEVINESIT
jgi:hypothetical protein